MNKCQPKKQWMSPYLHYQKEMLKKVEQSSECPTNRKFSEKWNVIKVWVSI